MVPHNVVTKPDSTPDSTTRVFPDIRRGDVLWISEFRKYYSWLLWIEVIRNIALRAIVKLLIIYNTCKVML
ncbi:hypothetical protein [Niabella digestorum]|uniref:Uncharacterized protein n=1 Tax=Niabella digestorum TaxID=3117701 RepID=A0ABU7RJ53_9BACT